jgi:predicted nucleotidyltransferase component of viral defense system
VLDPLEAAAVAEQYGVDDQQVRRDHLISHLLAVLAREVPNRVVFFGGTALARTHLPDGRLSEDIDLLAEPSRREVVNTVERVLASGVRREFGQLTWDPPLSAVRETAPAVLRAQDGLTIRIQLLDSTNHPRWPTESRDLVQRYSDAPAASLVVPTLAGFAASKTAAWHDRHAPRDLYDLWGLAQLGALNAESAAEFVTHGPTGGPPRPWMFTAAPTDSDWATQLGGQTRIAVDPATALLMVRSAWAAVVPTDD